MAFSTKLRVGLGALALMAGSAGLVALGGQSAQATAVPAASVLPAHVFAPYFEAYNGDNPVTLSQQSGAKYLIFAFIQTASKGSCTAYWNGSTSQPIGSTFASAIKQIQSAGGNVVPSFGGYSADTTGTDIADSCSNVSSIAAVYEKVITTYNLTRIDLDIEANSLTNSAGITRRDEAVAKVEAWAKANNRTVQFTYTLPCTPNGLDSQGTNVVKNAKSHGATITAVTEMTFDYYTGGSHEMAQATETAGQGLYNQLHSIYPSYSSSKLWGMVGVTEMEGIDDYGKPETFTEADATTVLNWAKSKHINEISFWALQRDNGGCPGTKGSDSCSGISQPTWFFSHKFEPFTS